MIWQWILMVVDRIVNPIYNEQPRLAKQDTHRGSLEKGLRQTLRAVADSEFLGADETAAMLARLTAAMGVSATRRAPRLGLSWVGAAAAFVFILMPLLSPWMTWQVRYTSQATPVVRLASAGAVAFSRQATPAPATALSAQPTVWPAMDLALSQIQETAYPKATSVARQRN